MSSSTIHSFLRCPGVCVLVMDCLHPTCNVLYPRLQNLDALCPKLTHKDELSIDMASFHPLKVD